MEQWIKFTSQANAKYGFKKQKDKADLTDNPGDDAG